MSDVEKLLDDYRDAIVDRAKTTSNQFYSYKLENEEQARAALQSRMEELEKALNECRVDANESRDSKVRQALGRVNAMDKVAALTAQLAEAERRLKELGDATMTATEKAVEAIDEKWDLRVKLEEAQRELGIQREMTLATKYAVIDTVGGVDYEGHPTGTLNYLQRLRILVEKERLFDTVSKNSDEWRAKFEQAQRENDATIEALEQKIKALAPHGTCACSYDSPNDKCLHHSPQLVKLTARNAELAQLAGDMLRALEGCLLREVTSIDPDKKSDRYMFLSKFIAEKKSALEELRNRCKGCQT